MRQKRKRVSQEQEKPPQELINGVGEEKAEEIMKNVRMVDGGEKEDYTFMLDADKRVDVYSILDKHFKNIEILPTYADYEGKTMRYHIRPLPKEFRKPHGGALGKLPKLIGIEEYRKRMAQPREKAGAGKFEGAPELPELITDYDEGAQAPVHERLRGKIKASLSKAEMDAELKKKLRKTLDFMLPRLVEHAERVQEGRPSKIPLIFDSDREAGEAEKVLRKTGMVGKVSRKEKLLILNYSPIIEEYR